jgi:hypothetical protein
VNQLDTEAMKAVVVFRIWLIFRPREEALAFLPSQPLRGCESKRISSDEEVWKDIEGRKVLPRLGIENGKDDTKETHHEKELWLLADDDATAVINALFERRYRIVHVAGHGEPVARDATTGEITRIRTGGGRIITIGVGAQVRPDYLRGLASRPEDYHFCNESVELQGTFINLATELGSN